LNPAPNLHLKGIVDQAHHRLAKGPQSWHDKRQDEPPQGCGPGKCAQPMARPLKALRLWPYPPLAIT